MLWQWQWGSLLLTRESNCHRLGLLVDWGCVSEQGTLVKLLSVPTCQCLMWFGLAICGWNVILLLERWESTNTCDVPYYEIISSLCVSHSHFLSSFNFFPFFPFLSLNIPNFCPSSSKRLPWPLALRSGQLSHLLPFDLFGREHLVQADVKGLAPQLAVAPLGDCWGGLSTPWSWWPKLSPALAPETYGALRAGRENGQQVERQNSNKMHGRES